MFDDSHAFSKVLRQFGGDLHCVSRNEIKELALDLAGRHQRLLE